MTLMDLTSQMEAQEGTARLLFSTPDGVFAAGSHITELKHAKVSAVDCGGNPSQWTETVVQLLDSPHGHPLTVSKLRGILSQSIEKIEGLGDSFLHFEGGLQNSARQSFRLSKVETAADSVTFHLMPTVSQCKPALAHNECYQSKACC